MVLEPIPIPVGGTAARAPQLRSGDALVAEIAENLGYGIGSSVRLACLALSACGTASLIVACAPGALRILQQTSTEPRLLFHRARVHRTSIRGRLARRQSGKRAMIRDREPRKNREQHGTAPERKSGRVRIGTSSFAQQSKNFNFCLTTRVHNLLSTSLSASSTNHSGHYPQSLLLSAPCLLPLSFSIRSPRPRR